MKKPVLFILLFILLFSCHRDIIEPSEPIDSITEPAIVPGTRTELGGLILAKDVLLDRDMKYIYLHIDQNQYDILVKDDYDLNEISSMVSSLISEKVFAHFNDNFDFIQIFSTENGNFPSFFSRRHCAAQGIGCEYDNSISSNYKGFVVSPGDNAIGGNVTLHEIAHYWANQNVIPSSVNGHWGFSTVGGILGGYHEISYLGNNRYLGTFREGTEFPDPQLNYSNLELYLMGLVPPDELQPIQVAVNPQSLSGDSWNAGEFTADSLITIYPNEFVEKWGERLPNFENSQKKFKILIVILDNRDILQAEKTDEKKLLLDNSIKDFTDQGSIENISDYELPNFWKATRGKATVEIKISQEDIKNPVLE